MTRLKRVPLVQAPRRRGAVLPVLIRELRLSKGMSQEQLAGLAVLNRRTVSRLELGLSRPYSHTLKAIANALGASFDDIIGSSLDSPSDNRTMWLVVEESAALDEGIDETGAA